ncbi:MAG: hypothetical protein HY813_01550 [Candidatus Portnoybacteria bacterium]|nr:hypothetical protein [Candidatus Portnoybacteria bacterium]
MENIYRNKVLNAPKIIFGMLKAQRKRLNKLQKKYGKQYTLPNELE